MNNFLKKCPSCGRFFECKGTDDCWCESYLIHRKEYFRLTQEFNDCLCPECLKKYSE